MVKLVCPKCKNIELEEATNTLLCHRCSQTYNIINGIPTFIADGDSDDTKYYDNWHNNPYQHFNLKNIGAPLHESSLIKKHERFFEQILYTKYKRERFFKRVAKMLDKDSAILDLGCGAGNNVFCRFENIYGIDYSMQALRGGQTIKQYKMTINADCTNPPLPSETFDCIISSDLIGHIREDKKDSLFTNISRLLKPNAITAHVIETDNSNFLRTFAKHYPDLYDKYFINAIGGHFGMEMPDVVINRFISAGLTPIFIKKYYTYIWDIESFIALFDNEYRNHSYLLDNVLKFYTLLCKNINVKIAATFLTGAASYIVDQFAGLEKAEGLLIICAKE
ncbi:Methyltransferase type 11 domain protein [Candidatus Magnetoovum chiemensis]|nr:Methyltransferase type 11 domain protein [Candidatus Magnetoovum chiemensis]